LPLICPVCRRRDENGFQLSSLDLVESPRESPDGEVLQGLLACRGCKHRYPIIDGIPVVVADLGRFLESNLHALVERDLDPAVAGLLALAGPDEAPYARLAEHLSIYLDAHWGDRATPPPDGPEGTPAFGMHQLAERLRGLQSARVPVAVELGCSAGRGTLELAAGADHVIGIDLQFASLRRARRLLRGEALAYPRRTVGRHYAPATIAAGPAVKVTLVCADALDPPLAPFMFGRVAALNLLDSLRHPAQLLAVMDKLCAPMGDLLLASPYAWQSGIVDEEHRLGGADPEAELVRRLRSGDGIEDCYTVEDQAQLTWWLRRDSRSGTAYAVHWLRARKRAT
jgi:uncharacterized protein YbaR (Trm112 family)